MSNPFDIYVEAGKKKVFAVSVHWPGWCRFDKDEESAIHKLLAYAPRYENIAQKAGMDFVMPQSSADFKVIQRVEGNSTTDFGAPAQIIPEDWEEMDDSELARLKQVMKAAWDYFDQVVKAAEGKELRKGPKGGGRDLDKIVVHVVGAEEGYLKTLGAQVQVIKDELVEEKKQRLRKAAFEGMRMKLEGLLPAEGPRGGKRWPVSYYVRRLIWHLVDHTWEIEDRITN